MSKESSPLTVDELLGIKHLEPNHTLNNILDSMFVAKGMPRPNSLARPFYWNPEFFGLDKVKFFTEAPKSTQEEILVLLSRGFLTESCFVERFGFSYAATLMLKSDTIEEKTTFALMAGDEARHFRDLTSHIDFDLGDSYKREPLILLLADIIQHGDKQSMIFMLQALLEGYGLYHYAMLNHGCNDTGFSSCLQKVLKDEGFHHAAGVALLNEKEMTTWTYEYLVETLARLTQIIQRNNGVLSAISRKLGDLSGDQQKRILKEIGYDNSMAHRMEKLKALVYDNAPAALRERMDKYALFKPLTAEEYQHGFAG